jgi:hypothetical protein
MGVRAPVLSRVAGDAPMLRSARVLDDASLGLFDLPPPGVAPHAEEPTHGGTDHRSLEGRRGGTAPSRWPVVWCSSRRAGATPDYEKTALKMRFMGAFHRRPGVLRRARPASGRDAAQLLLPAVIELEPRPEDEIPDRAHHQDSRAPAGAATRAPMCTVTPERSSPGASHSPTGTHRRRAALRRRWVTTDARSGSTVPARAASIAVLETTSHPVTDASRTRSPARGNRSLPGQNRDTLRPHAILFPSTRARYVSAAGGPPRRSAPSACHRRG